MEAKLVPHRGKTGNVNIIKTSTCLLG